MENSCYKKYSTGINLLNNIQGCLVGGAIGDALGYPVEFESLKNIQSRFGIKGISRYELDKKTGEALISSDTQMMLFTANGLLAGLTRLCTRGIGTELELYTSFAYQDWYST